MVLSSRGLESVMVGSRVCLLSDWHVLDALGLVTVPFQQCFKSRLTTTKGSVTYRKNSKSVYSCIRFRSPRDEAPLWPSLGC